MTNAVTIVLTKEQITSILDQIIPNTISNVSSMIGVPVKKGPKTLAVEYVSKLQPGALIYSQQAAATLGITTTQLSGALQSLQAEGRIEMLKRGTWQVKGTSSKK